MADNVRMGLLSAFRRLMQPLVRILVRNGVSYHEFAELLRGVFIEVAEHDFPLPGRRPSQSRIAILTGLSRKEVAKQKEILAGGSPLEAVSNLNRVTRVLEGWHFDPEYSGPYGLPLELPFEATTGPSFSNLVKLHSGDIIPSAMLEELLRVGAVERAASGALKVLTLAYIPQNLNPDALERFGEVVCNFVCTYEFNMEKPAPGAGRFERTVLGDLGLSSNLVPAFDKLIRTKGQQFLVELNNWLLAQEASPGSEADNAAKIKTGVGIYHFIEEARD